MIAKERVIINGVKKRIKMKKKDENRITITRKYVIIPVASPQKEWNKRIYKYTVNDLEFRIKYNQEKLEKVTDDDEKDKIKKHIEMLTSDLQDVKNGKDFTRKMINNYTYDLVRKSMESEALRKNYILSYVRDKYRINQVSQFPTLKEKNDFVSEIINSGCRVKGCKKGSLFDNTEIENILGSYGIGFRQSLISLIKKQIQDGILDGKPGIVDFKLDSPFSVNKTSMGFSYDYKNFQDLVDHINKPDCKMYFDFGGNGNPTIARFQINLGTRKNRDELKATLLKVYSGEYEYCGSSIQIDKNKIILNLSLSIPKQDTELDENTVVGVDLGVKIPAVCALNNNMYERLYIGSADDFLRVRTQLQAQRKRLNRDLKNTASGHGRKKKLRPMERFIKREAHFVESYCHMVSKRVVDFAVKHHAKYINVENLLGYDTSDFILRNWSYYKLQQYITYKAAKYNIVVRKVNPCYTSQVCSVCGHWEPDQRVSQASFVCKNEECSSPTKYKHGFNADFNAARNIAMSTLFMEKGQVTEESKRKARKYYGIPEPEENKEVAA